MRKWILVALITVASASLLVAQGQRRPASPRGSAATELGGKYVATENGGQRYEGGKWIEIDYGRPILRGRANIFGAGAEYGKLLNDGGPVWRAGANETTRLKTEVPLVIGGKTLAPGEYSLLVELKSEKEWTLIVSSQPVQAKYDPNDKVNLFGAYNYTPAKDVVRAPMQVDTVKFSVDQLTWGFTDVTNDGGNLRLGWERTMATIPFKVATSS